MDWDGIGTAALFLGTGGIGVAMIALRAYKARLDSRLEWERLRRSNPPSEEGLEQMRELETKVRWLSERVAFTERLLGKGHSEGKASGDAE